MTHPLVVVMSNEVGNCGCIYQTGFTPENVASLCDVAASTKVSSNDSIGEKGIGFKCLFRLSSSPRVYSNGYQFSLSSIPDDEIGYGYIVPRWLNSVPPAVKAVVNAGGTVIVLPTRSDTVTSLFLRTLAEVSSTAIMFLSRLQEVTIEVPDRPLRRISLRPLLYDVPNQSADTALESLMVSGEGERLVMRLRCNKTPPTLPAVTSSEVRRARSSSFRVNVALPLASGCATSLYCSFLVPHADLWLPIDVDIPQLILTANRESLIEDSPWNEWLLSHVLPLAYANCLRIAVEFISSRPAWEHFPFLSDFSTRWALLFLWLPELPSRKHRRFRSLVRRVLEETSHASFIPVCSDMSQLCLKAPSCCSVAPKGLTPNLYTLMIKALHKSSAEYLVLPELLTLDCEVHHFLDLVGCDVLSVSEVLRYLSRITLDPLTPADLAVLYNYCFKEGKGSVTVRSELASMPVMMATDGSRHSLASTPLQFYWPDERFLKTVGGLDAATLEVVSIISNVAIVHPHLANALSRETVAWLSGGGIHEVFDEEAFSRSLLQGISNAVGSPLVHHGDLVAVRPRCWNSGAPDPHYLPQFLQLVERCTRLLSEEGKKCEHAPLVVDLRNQPELHRHLFPFLELGQHNWLAVVSPKSHGASVKAKDMRLQLSFSDLIPETFLSANCLLLASFYNDNPKWVQENFPVAVRLAPSPPDGLPPCKSLSELLRGILVLAISGLVSKEHSWDFLLDEDRRISWRRALGTRLLSDIRTAHMFPDQSGRLRPVSELVDPAVLPAAPLADALHVLNLGVQEELKLLCHDIHGRVQKFLPAASTHRINTTDVLTKFLDHLGISGSFSIAVAVKILSLVSKLHQQVLTVQACSVVLATCEQVTRTQEWLTDKNVIRTHFATHPLIPIPLDVGSVRSWIRLDKEVVWADPAGHFQSRLVALEQEMPLHVQQKLKLFFDGLVSPQPSAELYAAEWTRLASGLVPPTKREQAKLKVRALTPMDAEIHGERLQLFV
ncbi:MAG: hypothetical protein KVP17_001229 [Porospora cf. gigantea B]|uniref:uncharacterized protein n=1 Tax=Porospora cf. gigantea B TaxID=2853592 RepID=UPI003571C798|nr:MAG: hypothetical protein KVP17_001229 [Porospora cf. gigantea B]